MIPTIRRRAGTALAAIALLAAGAALVPAPAAATGTPAAAERSAPAVTYLRAVAGDEQTVSTGRQVPQALTVKAMDGSFQPVRDVPVTFTTPGELTFPGGATTATVRTGADGTAQAPALTAGPAAGRFLVTAVVDRNAQTAFEITDRKSVG